MPPKLGKRRAQLSSEFTAVITKLNSDKQARLAKEIKKDLEAFGSIIPRGKAKLAIKIKRKQAELKSMQYQGGTVRDGAKRGGIEYDIMRLKRAPFVEFNIKDRVSHGQRQIWLVGKTKEIVSEIKFGREQGKRYHTYETAPDARDAMYNFGQFFICLNAATFGRSKPVWHLIPVSNWRETNRHMHHVVDAAQGNPLDWSVRTCWGAFNGIVQALWIDADVPELFHILYQFAAKMNPQSPLVGNIASMSHVKKIEEETE